MQSLSISSDDTHTAVLHSMLLLRWESRRLLDFASFSCCKNTECIVAVVVAQEFHLIDVKYAHIFRPSLLSRLRAIVCSQRVVSVGFAVNLVSKLDGTKRTHASIGIQNVLGFRLSFN